MNAVKKACCLAVGFAALGCTTSTAQAQWGAGYGSWPFSYGPGRGIYVHERIPQYALFPPVYYARPQYGSYGVSPYGVLPAVSWRETRPTPTAVVITNPYVVPGAQLPGPQPLRIKNPYYDGQ